MKQYVVTIRPSVNADIISRIINAKSVVGAVHEFSNRYAKDFGDDYEVVSVDKVNSFFDLEPETQG